MGELWLSRPAGRGGPRARPRERPAAAGRGSRPLLHDLRPRRRPARRPDRLPGRRRALPGGAQRRQSRGRRRGHGPSAWPASTPTLDDASPAHRAGGDPGSTRPGHPGPPHGRGPRGACATTPSPRARRRASRARVARTGLHGRGRLRAVRGLGRLRRPCGTACWRLAVGTASCRSAWAPATRCASRPACPSTGTSSTAPATPTRPASAASSSSTSRATSWAGPRWSASPATARARLLGGLIVRGRGIARHGYPVYAPAGEGERDGRGHERHRVADPRRAHRHGLRAPAAGRARVPWWRSAYATRASRPRLSPSRSTRACAEARSPSWTCPTACATPTITSGCASRATTGVVGITAYAAEQLGDIVFVELPESRHGAERGQDLRGRGVGEGGERPLRARGGRGQRAQSGPRTTTLSSSTAIPTARAG